MNADKIVWVEAAVRDGVAIPIRIFRSAAASCSARGSFQMRYGDAVKEIRHQIFVRSGGHCEKCGGCVTEQNGHMHEQKWRGRGGEISLENSLFICSECHAWEHRGRAPKWKQ